jgi:uncharacterized membrane protein YbhN (UPF0104 family)
MILLFAIKLLVWNFLHSILVGLVAMIPALAILPFSRSLEDGSAGPGVRSLTGFISVIVMVCALIVLPLLALCASEAVRLSLAADPTRTRWLWWLVVWLTAVQPWAISAVPARDEAEATSNVWMMWVCRGFMLVCVFVEIPLHPWLDIIAKTIAVK